MIWGAVIGMAISAAGAIWSNEINKDTLAKQEAARKEALNGYIYRPHIDTADLENKSPLKYIIGGLLFVLFLAILVAINKKIE